MNLTAIKSPGRQLLMQGNEAIVEGALAAGCRFFAGYPITPATEISEVMSYSLPAVGGTFIQMEDEIASICAAVGASFGGMLACTASSGPGISLMQEGISYIAGAELPCVIVNVVRGGPGLGTIQPSQADYLQSVKGGGHGDYRLIVLAPASVQEMSDFVPLAFDLAFKYRNPALILSDGVIGQMMEKVELFDQIPRKTEFDESWALTGKKPNRTNNIITSLDLDSHGMEKHNHDLQAKYKRMEEEEVRYEMINCDDAEYIYVAYGASARICQKTVEMAREEGIKVGLLRPITLWPFPTEPINAYADKVKGMLTVELNAGHMVEDVRLAVNGKIKVDHFGRLGGIVPTPDEVLEALKKMI